MHYGIILPNFGEYSDLRLLAELAHDAEAAGWEGFFLWDHIHQWHGQEPFADPWMALTAIALRTERIRLGPLVTPLARRRPWKLARETVTLDHLSGGRLILGVGVGTPQAASLPPEDFGVFGGAVAPHVRAARMDEGLAVLTGLWSGQPFSYDGTQYQVHDVCFLPPPVQQPRIPIWVGGHWPTKAPFRRAARWDGVYPQGRQNLPGTSQSQNAMNRRLTPAEIRALVAYITAHRTSAAPFEVVYAGQTSGKDAAEDSAIVTPYAEAGLTWWLETRRNRSLAAMRERIRIGPPQV
jgi:alkanesulfonate monooxygenase SsuD/methylene tetrahydromethanopterin reductase-like flavin-dependent oxidoreductase (luciferase family)